MKMGKRKMKRSVSILLLLLLMLMAGCSAQEQALTRSGEEQAPATELVGGADETGVATPSSQHDMPNRSQSSARGELRENERSVEQREQASTPTLPTEQKQAQQQEQQQQEQQQQEQQQQEQVDHSVQSSTEAPATSGAAGVAQEETATIEIVGPADTGIILAATEVELEAGDTVLDILKRITREQKIQMEYSGKKATAYVEGIDNLYEFDRGAGSGWMYSVNGSFPNRSAGAWTVEAGDVIRWLYTLDLGKDLGAQLASDEEER